VAPLQLIEMTTKQLSVQADSRLGDAVSGGKASPYDADRGRLTQHMDVPLPFDRAVPPPPTETALDPFDKPAAAHRDVLGPPRFSPAPAVAPIVEMHLMRGCWVVADRQPAAQRGAGGTGR